MSTGCHNQQGDVECTEKGSLDDAVGGIDGNTACAESGTSCLGDETGQAASIDAADPADGDANREGGPERHSLYEKVTNFNDFIDETAKGLHPISAMVWMTLFRFARGGIAWASQNTIAERLGLSPKTVYRHIVILKKKRLLRVVKKGRRGRRCNTYQLGILPLEPVAKRPERSKRKPR